MTEFVRKPLEGVFPFMPLCLKENQDIDYEGIESNIVKLDNLGVHGFIMLGCMGQMNAPSEEEFNKICDVCVEVSKNRNIVCVVSSTATNTREVIRRAKYAEDAGADGSMLSLPYAFPVTAEWAVNFYRMVDEALRGELAILLYNYPPLTGFKVTPALWKEHLLKIKSIKAFKESNFDIIEHDIALVALADKINWLSANDVLFWHDSMLGAKAMAAQVALMVPRLTVRFYEECRKGHQMDPWTLQVWKNFINVWGVWYSSGVQLGSYTPSIVNTFAEIGGFKAGPPRQPYGAVPAEIRRTIEEAARPLVEMENQMGGN